MPSGNQQWNKDQRPEIKVLTSMMINFLPRAAKASERDTFRSPAAPAKKPREYVGS